MFKRRCSICSKKITKSSIRKYINDSGKQINVCLQCADYAERRAYRKAK